ncbi:MAG: hypothetical protein IKY83_04580, partial [Proteobacteria bacterium]|nr:hypothetical protein [Pseudomonadota bacterium]
MWETLQCLLNSKCRNALSDIDDFDDWNADKAEARTACLLLVKYIKGTYHKYHKLTFTSVPAPPYYFMQAFIEREIHPYFVIKIGEGVIKETDSTKAIQEFIKHIDILHSSLTPKKLAIMVCSFHAGTTDFLVDDHKHATDYRKEVNPPEFHKSDDGSATLTYALKRDGRSVSVTQYTLHIA